MDYSTPTNSTNVTAVLVDSDGKIIDTIPTKSELTYSATISPTTVGKLSPLPELKRKKPTKYIPPLNRHERRKQKKLKS